MNKSKTLLFLSIISTSIYCQAGFFDIFSREPINSCASDPVISIISDLVKEQPDNLVNGNRYIDRTDNIIKNEVYLETLSSTQIGLINVETYSIDESTGRIICNAQVTIDGNPSSQISYETFILDGGESVGVRVYENLNEVRYGVLSHTFNKSNLQNKSNVFLTEEQVNKRDEYNKLQAIKIQEKEEKIANERIAYEQAYEKYLTYFGSDEFYQKAIRNMDHKINEAMVTFFEGEVKVGSMKLVEAYKKTLGSIPISLGETSPSIEEQFPFLKDPNYLNDLVSKTVGLIHISNDANLYNFSLNTCDGLSDEATNSYHSIKRACLNAQEEFSHFLDENSNDLYQKSRELLNTHLLNYLQINKLTGLQ